MDPVHVRFMHASEGCSLLGEHRLKLCLSRADTYVTLQFGILVFQ
jgi:hypothetical protein